MSSDIKKILIPTDGSDLADYAYEIAHRIAQQTNADIEALNMVSAPVSVLFDSQGNVKFDQEEDFTSLRDQQIEANELMDTWLRDKPDISDVTVRIGHIKKGILNYIEKEEIDLVIMGTGGSSGVAEWLVGSNAEEIVRNSSKPVLSIKCDRSGNAIKDILLVSDFKEKKKLNLNILKTIQSVFDSKLHLLKINTLTNFDSNRQIHQNMSAFAESNELGDISCHVYCDDTVEKGIINFSADTGIDFIAIGTSQRKGLGLLFQGSISKGLVNHLIQPVLTFPIRG